MSENSTPPAWAKQLLDDVADLKEQTLTNCGKLDKLGNEISAIKEDTRLLPQILEIVQANGNNHEVLSQQVDEISKRIS